jgi:hypothetical protein
MFPHRRRVNTSRLYEARESVRGSARCRGRASSASGRPVHPQWPFLLADRVTGCGLEDGSPYPACRGSPRSSRGEPTAHGRAASGSSTTASDGCFPNRPRGNPDPLRSRYGLELRRAETFAIERRPGWTETEDRLETLVDVQWADWDASGRLLVATTDGRLQVLGAEGPDSAVWWEVDLSADEPDPRPPPEEARRW